MPRLLHYADLQDSPLLLAFDSIDLNFDCPKDIEPVILEQKIRVETINGITVSTFEPPNEQLVARAKAMCTAPEVVYRSIAFRGDIPREYGWTIPHAEKPDFGGFGKQRMTYANWRAAIQREQLTGHAGPTGEPNLLRKIAKGD